MSARQCRRRAATERPDAEPRRDHGLSRGSRV